jgi:murein DD-endopeptidase MepM/ murein hydrolase activator NlpD
MQRPPRCALWCAPLASLLLLLTAGPAGADERLGVLQSRIAAARAQEAQLAGEIDSLTSRIRELEAREGDVALRLDALNADLALYQRRLDKIKALFKVQTERLHFLKGQYATALARAQGRLVELYQEGDHSAIEVVLGASSLSEMVDRLDYMQAVARQDTRIVGQVAAARVELRSARARTAKVQQKVAASTRVIAYRRDQVAALRESLLADGRSLAAVRDQRQHSLADTRESEEEWLAEASAMRQANVAIASAISSPPSSPTSSPPSSAGLIWPVSGPINSPYGMRWGSLHPGIDIGAGTGTPIKAAASGRVVVAGYSGGYGNLTVIDHGNGIVTAYAHQSSLAASAGQQVAQGQVIGYVGSTGFSTGPHLHFEVRVNGSPVDPLGYL